MIVELDEVFFVEVLFSEFELLFDDEVYMLIKKVVKKFCLLDLMFMYLIFQFFDVFFLVIIIMINLLFNIGYFVYVWKEVFVFFLLKKFGLDVVFKNFRLVSNLLYIFKLFERVVVCQLM